MRQNRNLKKRIEMHQPVEMHQNMHQNNVTVLDTPLFNILITASYQPEQFRACIKSIFEQTYTRYRVIVSYNDNRCKEYLNEFQSHENITLFKSYQYDKSPENIYINEPLSKAAVGWNIVLNDSDTLTHNMVFAQLRYNMQNNNNNILYWKVKEGNKIFYPKNVRNINREEIACSGFCFHSNYTQQPFWTGTLYNKTNFIVSLLQQKNLRHVFIDMVLAMRRKNIIKPLEQSEYYIINNNLAGGSNKWVNDISNNLGHNLERIYKENQLEKMLKRNENKEIVIIINSFLHTDFTVDILLKYHDIYKFKIILPIHDWFWIDVNNNYTMRVHNIYLNRNIKLADNTTELFKRCEKIICPSIFVYDIIKKIYNNTNLILKNWIDYDLNNTYKTLKFSKKNVINIGVLVDFNECKGKEQVEYLISKYKYNQNIKFWIVGVNIERYKDEMTSFIQLIKKYNIHGLMYLNKWGETWCYGLTKGLLSGLPILYNNIGAFKERVPKDDRKYIINNNNETEFYDYKILENNFEKLVNYIIINNNIFITKAENDYITNKSFINELKIPNKKIKKYAIYFPQFHKIKENDINFYDGYTDIINLKNLNIENKETPNKEMLNLNSIEDYDLDNNSLLIAKQIELLEKYNIDGFGMYYYWFSINTITNNNTIMYNIHEKFLNAELKGKKIFFIWANENWSDNPAFGSSNNIVKNIYNKKNFNKQFNLLIKAFKSDNYLKNNNKPVFYIHHPWCFTNNYELTTFIEKLDEECIKHNFDGIDIKLNNMNKEYTKNVYEFHPNYKKTKTIKYIDGKTILDYNEYVNQEVNNSSINTIFFDFDNRARLNRPDRLDQATICINNTKELFIKYLNKIKNSNTEILLINAWNEWGEKMHVEPSEEKGDYYLKLINLYL